MTIICQPIDASGGVPAYTAQASRQAFSSLMGNGTNRPLGAISGIRPGQGGETSISGATITVQPFSAIIDPAFSASQAPYQVASNAAEARVITAAHATLARIDILYIQVSDTAIDSSGGRAAALLYLAGTPAGSPVKPALPARSVEYAVINVPASGGGSATFSRTIGYAVASGGILPVASSAGYPTTPYIGQVVHDLALGYPLRYSGLGGGWVALGTFAECEVQQDPGTLTISNGSNEIPLPNLKYQLGSALYPASGGIYVPSGRYTVDASLTFGSNVTGRRFVQICPIGSSTPYRQAAGNPFSGLNFVVTLTGTFTQATSGIIMMRGYQDSGGNLGVASGYMCIRQVA